MAGKVNISSRCQKNLEGSQTVSSARINRFVWRLLLFADVSHRKSDSAFEVFETLSKGVDALSLPKPIRIQTMDQTNLRYDHLIESHLEHLNQEYQHQLIDE